MIESPTPPPAKPTPRPAGLGGLLFMLVLVAGVLSSVWLGDWRWALTGACAALVLPVAGAVLERAWSNHQTPRPGRDTPSSGLGDA